MTDADLPDRTRPTADDVRVPAARPLPGVARRHRIAGELVYAIGDIHGQYDLFTDLLATIADDARERADGRRPILIFVGDYVDRGPDSARILSALVWLGRHADYELHLLKGNHEAVLLDYLAAPEEAREWLRFGGDATLRSYGIDAPDTLDPIEDHYRARDALLDAMPAAHLHLLQRLELSCTIGDYAFVHAGVRPGVALHKQTEQDLLWIREDFLTRDHRFDKIIVHGHSWDDAEPVDRSHRIGIDTGAYETGVLTAVRIEDEAIAFLHARRQPDIGRDGR